jgi:hypothetical protein
MPPSQQTKVGFAFVCCEALIFRKVDSVFRGGQAKVDRMSFPVSAPVRYFLTQPERFDRQIDFLGESPLWDDCDHYLRPPLSGCQHGATRCAMKSRTAIA